MRQKGFAHLIVLIIVLIGVGGMIYFFSKYGSISNNNSEEAPQTKRIYPVNFDPVTGYFFANSTDNWSEYKATRKVIKFSMQLPENWKYDEQKLTDTISIRGTQINDNEDNKIAEFHTVLLKPDQTCFDNFSIANNRMIPEELIELISNQSITIANLRGRKIITKEPQDALPGTVYWTRYCLQEGNKAFVIKFVEVDKMDQKKQQLFSQVLSTFKFTN